MRGLSKRRVATTALCAALLAGVTDPAVMAADSIPGRSHAASPAQAPGAEALLAWVKSLGDFGGALTPVAHLLDTALKADNGQLPAAQAARLVHAAKRAVADMTPRAAADPQAKDAASDALAALQNALDALQKAITSGDPSQVTVAVTDAVTALTDYLAAMLPTPTPSGLPTPSLPALPAPMVPTT